MESNTLEQYAQQLLEQSKERTGLSLTEADMLAATGLLVEDIEKFLREYLLSHLTPEQTGVYVALLTQATPKAAQEYIDACIPHLEETMTRGLLDFSAQYTRR